MVTVVSRKLILYDLWCFLHPFFFVHLCNINSYYYTTSKLTLPSISTDFTITTSAAELHADVIMPDLDLDSEFIAVMLGSHCKWKWKLWLLLYFLSQSDCVKKRLCWKKRCVFLLSSPHLLLFMFSDFSFIIILL